MYEDTFKSVREKGVKEGTAVGERKDTADFIDTQQLKSLSQVEHCHNIGYPSRTIQATLNDMHRILTDADNLFEQKATKNLLLTLVNEAQVYSNRMEGALNDIENYKYLKEECDNLNKQINRLTKERNELRDEIE